MKYLIMISPLPKRDGGGFIGVVPDLPGCLSDGETAEEAMKNTQQAIKDWVAEAKRLKRKVPKPGAAVQKTKAAAERVKQTLNALHLLDERLNNLAADVRELREIQENAAAWSRFSDLTAIPTERPKRQRHRVDC